MASHDIQFRSKTHQNRLSIIYELTTNKEILLTENFGEKLKKRPFYQKCAEIDSFSELLNGVLFLNSIFERQKLI